MNETRLTKIPEPMVSIKDNPDGSRTAHVTYAFEYDYDIPLDEEISDEQLKEVIKYRGGWEYERNLGELLNECLKFNLEGSNSGLTK